MLAHGRWFVVFFVGSVHLPDIPRWLPAPRETGAGYINVTIIGQKACPRGRPWPKSVSGRVWARMVHSVPTRETPALDAEFEAATRLV